LPRFTSATAAAGALTGLVIALGSASGAHFNPLISGIQWLMGERSLQCAAGYALAQVAGAVVGGAAGRFLLDGVSAPMTSRSLSWILVTSEFVSATALMTIVLGCSRSAKADGGGHGGHAESGAARRQEQRSLGPMFHFETSGAFFALQKSNQFAPQLATIHNVMALPGGVAFTSRGEMVGALGIGGAPGGDKDEVCAQAGVAKVKDRLPQ
jgi:hypothetical protein